MEAVRSYEVTGGIGDSLNVRYLDKDQVWKLKGLRYGVRLTWDLENNPVERVIKLPNGRGQKNCEFCEDNKDSQESAGFPVRKANRKVVLKNGGEVFVCVSHLPPEEKEKEPDLTTGWRYTD